jgi:hypothetical protein
MKAKLWRILNTSNCHKAPPPHPHTQAHMHMHTHVYTLTSACMPAHTHKYDVCMYTHICMLIHTNMHRLCTHIMEVGHDHGDRMGEWCGPQGHAEKIL